MSTVNTGGPAFPAHGRWGRDGELTEALQYNGMTLRDYFATKAMHALASDNHLDRAKYHNQRNIAVLAYQIADAMLKVREE